MIAALLNVTAASPVFVMVNAALAVTRKLTPPKSRGSGVIAIPRVTAWPLPLSEMASSEPDASLVTSKLAVLSPAAEGAKAMVRLHVAAGLRALVALVIQVFPVRLKSFAFVPFTAMELKVRLAVPVFVSTTALAGVVPKLAGPKATTKLDALRSFCVVSPVPEREIDWGEPAALSETTKFALRAPVATGVNVTPIVQLVPGSMPFAQELPSMAKSPEFTPVSETPVTVTNSLPVF